MPDLYISFASFTLSSYTAYLALAVLAGAGGLVYAQRRAFPAGALVDVCLLALIGAALLARAEHVLLQWQYFSAHTEEIVQINRGGLDWHGALLGGLIGLALAARWRGLKIAPLLDTFAPFLPLIGIMGWYGCLAWGCGFGAEVDTLAHYPAFAVSESPDVYRIIAPRYNTQMFGAVWSLLTLVCMLILLWRGWLRGARFWWALALMSAGMFVIGFWRGDAVMHVGGLRLDQWLDLAALIVGICTAFIQTAASQKRVH